MSFVRHREKKQERGGKERKGGRKTRERTFADINDERVWARGHVDPLPRHILHLQAGVIRRL